MLEPHHLMDQSEIIDEIESERAFFWTVTQQRSNLDRSLTDCWNAYGYPEHLKFAEFWDIFECFGDFVKTTYGIDTSFALSEQIEIFIAQQTWLDKCSQGIEAFSDQAIGNYLISIDYHRWLFQQTN